MSNTLAILSLYYCKCYIWNFSDNIDNLFSLISINNIIICEFINV